MTASAISLTVADSYPSHRIPARRSAMSPTVNIVASAINAQVPKQAQVEGLPLNMRVVDVDLRGAGSQGRHGESDAALLARELFNYSHSDGSRARTLLLSATPYRMLTLTNDEPNEGDPRGGAPMQ